MMNADAGRSGLDVASSNRGLKEAIESRDIAAVRAEEDKNTAYHHAQDAGNEALEAENKYKDAAKPDEPQRREGRQKNRINNKRDNTPEKVLPTRPTFSPA